MSLKNSNGWLTQNSMNLCVGKLHRFHLLLKNVRQFSLTLYYAVTSSERINFWESEIQLLNNTLFATKNEKILVLRILKLRTVNWLAAWSLDVNLDGLIRPIIRPVLYQTANCTLHLIFLKNAKISKQIFF